MGDGMPYHLEKGPFYSLAESVVNGSKADRYSILQLIRANKPLTDVTGPGWMLSSTTLQSPFTPTPADIAAHGQDFMGGKYKSGTFVPDPAMGGSTVGFRNYNGDIEGIFRTTFIRGIEVSLGLKRDELLENQDPANARFWPIEYVWKCPIGWVEGWVRWQRAPDGSGHVNISLLVPAHGQGILERVEDGRNAVKEPKTCTDANGMWVITHRRNKPTYTKRVDWSEFGVWFMPTFGPVYEGVGPIVTVAPSEADGGVKPYGRAYIPPAAPARRRRPVKRTP
ncbi:MAG: hypothetical protein QOG30_804 [Acidimicrobiaceae bacterium]|jgi:hypothetical protein